MRSININDFLLCMLVVGLLASLAESNQCLIFNQRSKKCSLCPEGTRLFKGNCLYNIDFCLQYFQGIDCSKCQTGYKVVKNEERIQCRKLQTTGNNDFTEEEIDYNLQRPQDLPADEKQQFYRFLNDYFTNKYQEQNHQSRLVKILDRDYLDGNRAVSMFYKTETEIQKATVTVIGHYKSFEIKEIVSARKQQISDDQVVEEDLSHSQKRQSSRIKNQLNQKQRSQFKTTAESQKNDEEIKETSDFNYEYQKPQIRQNDIGFRTSNEFIKLSNSKILQEDSKVVGCLVKNSGLRKHYRILYKTPSQQVYEGEVIYDVVKRRAFILNFGKKFSSL